MDDCIFCKIIRKEIPSDILYENERVVAFKDINPAAPVHILIVPKAHIKSFMELDKKEHDILSDVADAIKYLANKYGLSEGFRVVNNCGASAGQSVEHIHFHLLGGRDMQWPPG